MVRHPLSSNTVLSAGYDEAHQVLEVEFAGGRVYRYRDVPAGVYAWLCRSRSKGAFVSRMVADRYAYERLDEMPVPNEDPHTLADALRASLEQLETGRKSE
ncbi:MAG: KTSC domain-containing protein [Myxococcales bacterium]|nr:KTSC domain-containing protein [Myxococcales bacterium]